MKILEVKNLITQYYTGKEMTTVVNNVSFDLYSSRSLAIVGESGSGKSSIALSLMRLIEPAIGTITAQGIFLKGKDILQLSLKEIQEIRGNYISLIFQDPMTALNPVFTIGEQIIETIELHQQVALKEAKIRCLVLLSLVGIPAPHQRILEYPHQISCGMRQRVMIAMALACNPSVLIADEPTTALDVTAQAQIMDLVQRLQVESNMSILLITHDLSIVAEICDEVAVMYGGSIIEKSSVQAIFDTPLHPYTQALLNTIPSLSGSFRKLRTIDGIVSPLSDLTFGCSFQNRCPSVKDQCRVNKPPLQEKRHGHFIACFYPLQ